MVLAWIVDKNLQCYIMNEILAVEFRLVWIRVLLLQMAFPVSIYCKWCIDKYSSYYKKVWPRKARYRACPFYWAEHAIFWGVCSFRICVVECFFRMLNIYKDKQGSMFLDQHILMKVGVCRWPMWFGYSDSIARLWQWRTTWRCA